jgi:prepilin-type N-terminal cleavage/methylation domain-containing protein
VNIPGNTERSLRHPRGLTLIEVMLVLCIMTILAALAWPAVNQMLKNQNLRLAADRLKTVWLRARLDAMNSGRVLRFSYDPLNGAYRLESGAGENNADVSSSSSAGDNSAPQVQEKTSFDAATGDYVPLLREDTLPEGIRFVLMNATASNRDNTAGQMPGGFGINEQLQSTPVFFYPDGSTSTARLVLGNDQDRGIALSLRGLTGVVTVGEITLLQNQMLQNQVTP